MPTDARPLICILDGSVAITGALIAARREAALLADKARFMLVLPEHSQVADADLPEFERVIRLPIVHLRRTWRDAPRYLPALAMTGYRLAKLLRTAGCTRLQVNDFYLMQGAASRMFGFAGCIATWIRIDPRRFGLIGSFWLHRAEASSDRLVAVSRFIQGALPTDTDTALIYDAAPDAAPKTVSAGRRFLFVGNYIEGKGQDLAVHAFHSIAPDFPDAELILVGGDMGLDKNRAYRDRLRDLARSGAGRQQIHIEEYAADPAPLYAAAFAALNCSASESFSLTCQEASSYGLPVIATRSGGPEEIIEDGVTGFLVPVGDGELLADRIRVLLSDPQRAAAIGRAGAQRMRERFGPDQFREGLIDIFGL